MNTFAQSPLSKLLTPEISQESSNLVVVGGKQSNRRSPLYKADAETQIAPFIKRNMAKEQVDPRRYVVLAGGGIVYEPGEKEKLGQQDLSKIKGAQAQDRMVAHYRTSRQTLYSGQFEYKGQL